MIADKEEVRETVLNHLYNLNARWAFQCFPYLTEEISSIIWVDVYNEMIQMSQDGNLINYYKRIKNNAV